MTLQVRSGRLAGCATPILAVLDGDPDASVRVAYLASVGVGVCVRIPLPCAAAARAKDHAERCTRIADQGPWVVWCIVGSGADHCAGGADHWHACRVGRVAWDGWCDGYAALCEWITLGRVGVSVDVRQVVEDAAPGPCKLELGDGGGQGVVEGELDGRSHVLGTVRLGHTASRCHLGEACSRARY